MDDLNYRATLLNTLVAIATLDEATGPVELICGWFDDLYFPARKFAPSVDREAWDKALKEWAACFSSSELEVLSAFHVKYESLVDKLTTDPQNFKQDANWQAVAATARDALRRLDITAE